MKPYWTAYMNTKKWQECFEKIKDAESEEELKKAASELLQGYDDWLENLLGDDGK